LNPFHLAAPVDIRIDTLGIVRGPGDELEERAFIVESVFERRKDDANVADECADLRS